MEEMLLDGPMTEIVLASEAEVILEESRLKPYQVKADVVLEVRPSCRAWVAIVAALYQANELQLKVAAVIGNSLEVFVAEPGATFLALFCEHQDRCFDGTYPRDPEYVYRRWSQS